MSPCLLCLALAISNLITLAVCVRACLRLARLSAEARASRSVINGLAARVEAQAKLLARRAEK